ncbi:MAG: guanylate kinase [Desulfuromonadales bacterium]|nr:guanylate kinase [Desulfuromonadales bacterium]
MNKPAPKLRKGILYVISAPSGAGKTSICRKILTLFPHLRQSISYTTRTRRADEQEGRDYHFVSREDFDQMVADGAFAEWAEVHGNCYGTACATLQQVIADGADILLEIDVQGAEQLRNSGLDGVFIFILPPGMSELRKRLESRNTDDEKIIARRIDNAAGEIAGAVNFDYLVVNDVLDQAVEMVRAIMIAETARTDRVINALPEEFGLK